MLGYLKRGEAYRQYGELETALKDLRTASRLDPSATRPLELLGDVEQSLGRYDRATTRYEQYIRIDDRSPRVLYKLALSQASRGERQRRRGCARCRPQDRRGVGAGALLDGTLPRRAEEAGTSQGVAAPSGGALAGASRRARRSWQTCTVRPITPTMRSSSSRGCGPWTLAPRRATYRSASRWLRLASSTAAWQFSRRRLNASPPIRTPSSRSGASGSRPPRPETIPCCCRKPSKRWNGACRATRRVKR